MTPNGEDELSDIYGIDLPLANAFDAGGALAQVTHKIDSGKALLKQATQEFADDIQGIIDSCKGCIGNCSDCVSGRIGVICDKNGKCIADLQSKLVKHLQGKIESAAGYTFNAMSELGLLDDAEQTMPAGEPQELKPFNPATIEDVLAVAVQNGQDWRDIDKLPPTDSTGTVTVNSPGDDITDIGGTPQPIVRDGSTSAGSMDCSNGPDSCKPDGFPRYVNGVFVGCNYLDGRGFVPCSGSTTITHGGGTCTDTVKVACSTATICVTDPNDCTPGTGSGGGCPEGPPPNIIRCDVAACETECTRVGGSWIEDATKPGTGKCVNAAGQVMFNCGAVDALPSKPCFLTDGDCKTFVSQDKTGRYQYVASPVVGLSGMVHDTLTDEWFHCDGSDCKADKPIVICCDNDSFIKGFNTTETTDFDDTYSNADDIGDTEDYDFSFDDGSGSDTTAVTPTLSKAPARGPNKPDPPDFILPLSDCGLGDIDKATERLDKIESTGNESAFDVLARINNVFKETGKLYSQDVKVVGFAVKAIISSIPALALSFVFFPIRAAVLLMQRYVLPSTCNPQSYLYLSTLRGVLGMFGGWFGFIPPSLIGWLERNSNLTCQLELPGPAQLSQARLRQKIEKREWEFGMKQYGFCIEDAEKIYQAETNFVFSPQDVQTFMTRDIFGEGNVDDFKLDDGFDELYDSLPEKWIEKQGLTADQFRLLWHSHWQYPGAGQAVEMYRRLREDANVTTPAGEQLIFTYDDMTELMKFNGIAPGFIDKLAAIASSPLNKRDIRSAYVNNALQDDDLKSRFLDLGYNDDNAEILKNYIINADGPSRAKLSGQLPATQVDALYLADEINDDDYDTLIRSSGIREDTIEQRLQSLRLRRSSRNTKELLAVYRRAYLKGRLSNDEYSTKLDGLSLTDTQSSMILKRDREAKDVSDKQIAISKLCKLVEQGYLSVDDYMSRATNLGYSQYDASLLAQSCNADIAQHKQRETLAELRKQQAAGEKALKAAKKQQAENRKAARYRWQFKDKPKKAATTPQQQPPEPYFDIVPPQPPIQP